MGRRAALVARSSRPTEGSGCGNWIAAVEIDGLVLACEQAVTDHGVDDALDAGHLLLFASCGALEGPVDAGAEHDDVHQLPCELVGRQRAVAVAAVCGVDDDGLEVIELRHAEVQALVVSGQDTLPCTISSVYGQLATSLYLTDKKKSIFIHHIINNCQIKS